MQTLTDFKKAVQIGVKLKMTHHQKFAGRDETGKVLFKDEETEPREVSRKQTTQFALKTTRTDGTTVDSWMQFGKASECKIEGNKITFYQEDWRQREGKPELIKLMTYEICN